ncbi:MAG: MarR family transcriptional regulator [Clostridiales bacterium]|jgi:DNA-binding MarR family transcriptional regulator|nr:MarR family transcriptional regulator [Eubacteriales bacterium]MDH7567514.1 MarR family transcriptional regulator [Clostridiales bacterium]
MMHVVELLSSVYRQIGRALLPVFKAEGLSITELIILWKVSRRGTYRATELAKDAGVPASTFTGIFDRLAAKGLVKRINDPEDRRSVLVQGTPKLKAVMDRIYGASNEKLEDIFKSIPQKTMDRLAICLQQVYQYMLQYDEKTRDAGPHGK